LPAVMGPDHPDEADWPDGEIAAAGSATAAAEDPAEAEPELPEGVSAYDGEPLWSYRLDVDSGSVTKVDQGTLVHSDGSLRLVAENETVWEHTWEDYGPEIGVAGEVVVISRGGLEDAPWPGRQ